MAKFWLVWNPDGRSPTFKHPTIDSAKNEAERLARENPGRRFIVMEPVAACRKTDVTWQSFPTGIGEDEDEDETPF